jgi:hypothetical protein
VDFQEKHRTANITVCLRIGQAKYLIKQHDTADFGVRRALHLAVPARFVNMP